MCLGFIWENTVVQSDDVPVIAINGVLVIIAQSYISNISVIKDILKWFVMCSVWIFFNINIKYTFYQETLLLDAICTHSRYYFACSFSIVSISSDQILRAEIAE